MITILQFAPLAFLGRRVLESGSFTYQFHDIYLGYLHRPRVGNFSQKTVHPPEPSATMSLIDNEPNPVRQFETLLGSTSFVFLICKLLPLTVATALGNTVAYSQYN